MEYTEGIIKDTIKETPVFIHPNEYEQASRSYLMAVVAVIAGLPFPIINLFASIGYYLAHRKSSYFIRWHCIQATIGQALLIPFNSVAVAWTLGVIFGGRGFFGITEIPKRYFADNASIFDDYSGATLYYWLYITFIVLLNVTEFIVVIYTSSRVKKGENIRWFGIAQLTDKLCSKEDRNIYKN
jgi:hypothetical protein